MDYERKAKMIQIYHAPGTRSVRPIWLCFELGLKIEITTVPFTPEYLASEEWRAINPAGKLPILRDDELVMFESGAMMDYLLDKYGEGRLRPQPGTKDAALHQQWSWFAESTLLRPLGLRRLLAPGDNDLATEARGKVEDCIRLLENSLVGKEFLLDQFYAVDIMMGYSLELLRRFQILDERYPNALRYVTSLIQRDARQRALAA